MLDVACDDNTFCLQKLDDVDTCTCTTMALKKTHSYYYQVNIINHLNVISHAV